MFVEPTVNFAHALEYALNRRHAKGMESEQDESVRYLVANQHSLKTGNNDDLAMRRIHRKVRRLYILKTWDFTAFFRQLDWGNMVDWLEEHWDDILKIILMILPFIL